MGTPRFAAEILDELAEFHEIAAVYTRPDAVRGRGKALVPSPVKEVAERRGFPVRTPRTLRDAAVLSELAAFAPDVICVAAYGAILPKEVLDLPPFGCLNVHGSLLPRWRGAAPIERAILAGDEEIGVCIMAMEEGSTPATTACAARCPQVRAQPPSSPRSWQPWAPARCSRRWPRPRAATCAGWPRTRRWSPTPRRSPKAS